MGGTTAYFMTSQGCCADRDHLYVQALPEEALGADPETAPRIRWYEPLELRQLLSDSPAKGFTLMVLPANGAAHRHYAEYAPGYPQIRWRAVAGWVSGVHADEHGTSEPAVINGEDGQVCTQRALAMHCHLPPGLRARVRTLNPFSPLQGPVITFTERGFTVRDCLFNGEPTTIAECVANYQEHAEFPLVAEVAGMQTNVSIRRVHPRTGEVTFYAPVFPGIAYRFSQPLHNYAERIRELVPEGLTTPVFSCACILNYKYGRLEGQKISPFSGPITFGEIAGPLLNQTFVYLEFIEAA